jgi:hypothetical protein
MTVSLTYGRWNIQCHLAKSGRYIAYGSTEPIPENPAIDNPWQDIYFQIAPTQEKAIAKLKEELDTVK